MGNIQPLQLNNPSLSSQLDGFDNPCVWPLKITIHDCSHAKWNAIHGLEHSKQVKGQRLELGYSSSGLKFAQKAVKEQQQLVAKGAATVKKTFQIPQQVLEIEYAKLVGNGRCQHVTECYKIGGQDEYANFAFNQHGEFVRVSITTNTHTTPLLSLDDEKMPLVLALGFQKWQGKGFDATRSNTQAKLATFPVGKLLNLFFQANKDHPTVLPLTVLQQQQQQASRSSLNRAGVVPSLGGSPATAANNTSFKKLVGHSPPKKPEELTVLQQQAASLSSLNRAGVVPSLGGSPATAANNTSFKKLVGHSPPKKPEEREAAYSTALLESAKKEKKAQEELAEKTAEARYVFINCVNFPLICCCVCYNSNFLLLPCSVLQHFRKCA